MDAKRHPPCASLAPALLMPPKNRFLSRNPRGGFLGSSEHFGGAMGT